VITRSLKTRLEKLEQAMMKPAARVFCMFDREGEGSPGEREAAFRAENAVEPHDTLLIVRWLSDAEAPAPA
jgi:hypothetical protein